MEINGMNQVNTPTLYSKVTKAQENPSLGTALHEALPSFQTSRGRGIRRKRREYLNAPKKDHHSSEKQDDDEEGDGVDGNVDDDDDDEDEDEKKEVKRKIVTLQRIIPGGEDLDVDKLFGETAEYILALQCQIRAMKVLTSFIEGMEKHKTKLGG